MSRADDVRQSRSKQQVRAAALPPGTRLVIGGSTESYLARIAELEEEVRTLKAELAKLEASASTASGEGRGGPPSVVTADGTRGMQRGVSAGRSRSDRGRGQNG